MSALGFTLIMNNQPQKHQSEWDQEASHVLRTYYFKRVNSRVVAALTKIRSNKSLKTGLLM